MPRIDRVLLSAGLSGLLLAAAFPRPDLYPLAWVGLLPMLLTMRRRPFAAGFTCGLFFFGAVLYWLNIVMTTYGGLAPIFSLLAYFFLLVYLALYFAVPVWLSCRCEDLLSLPVLLTLPVFWVTAEYLRGLLLTGFPWALLGYSQQNFAVAIQSADVTGVYGVSFLLVLVNCALAWGISTPRSRRAWVGFGLVVLVCCSHFGYGFWRQSQPLAKRAETLKVALIQGNIEQAQKWDPAFQRTNVEKYLHLSTQAALKHPDLVVWPEAATPFYLQDPIPLAKRVKREAQQLGSAFLIGSPAYRAVGPERFEYFNSAYLISAAGREVGRSDKIHLVPFGEYVPLGKLLSFVDKMVVGVGDFSPGTVRPLRLNGHQLGVLICYEAIFPELARAYVQGGADLLVNITNDAWFGRSSAPYQHLAMTRFRAIENRIWLARAANTGISALISPAGKVVASGPLFKDFFLTGTVGLGAEHTLYTRFGDVFAWGCLALTAVIALLAVRRRRG